MKLTGGVGGKGFQKVDIIHSKALRHGRPWCWGAGGEVSSLEYGLHRRLEWIDTTNAKLEKEVDVFGEYDWSGACL